MTRRSWRSHVPSSPQNDDILCSDANGAYDISFFSASIGHSVETSQEVFAKFSGGMLSQFSESWLASEPSERRTYLLEVHELAHHSLMYSTPAGALIWRINQVISRDVNYLLKQCRVYGIKFTGLKTPEAALLDEAFQTEFLKGAAPDERAKKDFFLYVVDSLHQLVELRNVLMGKNLAQRHKALTVQEFLDLANSAYRYLAERCECSFPKEWKTRLAADELVFPEQYGFNMTDIAECHAVSAELLHLRALGDMDGFKSRSHEFRAAQFARAFVHAESVATTSDVFGISPHFVQLHAMMSFCGQIDTTDVAERYVEDEFPWWRFRSDKLGNSGRIAECLLSLSNWGERPLFGEDSRWIQYGAGNPLAADQIERFLGSLASFGLEMQVQQIHAGARINARYLATMLNDSATSKKRLPFEPLTTEQWREKLFFATPFIEYTDGFLFNGYDLDEAVKPDHPLRKLPVFDYLRIEGYQMLAHLINGASARNSYAEFAGCIVPSVEILKGKLARQLRSEQLAGEFCKLLSNVYETGRPHLRLLPAGAGRTRYI